MKHHQTNGSSVLQTMRSYEGMVVRFFSLKPWLSLFSGHISRQVIASLFWHYQMIFEVKWKHFDNDYKLCVTKLEGEGEGEGGWGESEGDGKLYRRNC